MVSKEKDANKAFYEKVCREILSTKAYRTLKKNKK